MKIKDFRYNDLQHTIIVRIPLIPPYLTDISETDFVWVNMDNTNTHINSIQLIIYTSWICIIRKLSWLTYCTCIVSHTRRNDTLLIYVAQTEKY